MRRLDFWILSSVVFLAMATAASLMAVFTGVDLANPLDPRTPIIEGLAVLLFTWPNLAISVQRLHDRDQSGWWVLLGFLPLIGSAWTIINLGIMRGTEGPNRYGEDPERRQLTLIPRAA